VVCDEGEVAGAGDGGALKLPKAVKLKTPFDTKTFGDSHFNTSICLYIDFRASGSRQIAQNASKEEGEPPSTDMGILEDI
jgi:hypothetical protein